MSKVEWVESDDREVHIHEVCVALGELSQYLDPYNPSYSEFGGAAGRLAELLITNYDPSNHHSHLASSTELIELLETFPDLVLPRGLPTLQETVKHIG